MTDFRNTSETQLPSVDRRGFLTAAAAAALVSQLSAEVIEFAFVIELTFLGGRKRLNPHGVFSIIQYETE